jgi:hypothetical protein
MELHELAEVIAESIKAATDPLKAEIEKLKKAQDVQVALAEVKPILDIKTGEVNKSASAIKALHFTEQRINS